MSVPFDEIASRLLARAESHCRQWLPAGKVVGHEYKIGNLQGEAGGSLSINLNTGVWKDFSSGESGNDLVALYAGTKGLSQYEAAIDLFPEYAPKPKTNGNGTYHAPAPIVAPPPDPPSTPNAVALYRYTDTFYVARFEPEGGKKTFSPFTWDGTQWQRKTAARPRPLYGLDDLAARPTAPVLVVEGEKSAQAAAALLPAYVVMTWAGGASSVKTADWRPLAARDVIIWPDADEPGRVAATQIAELIVMTADRVRIVTPADRPEGWDLADAVTEGWTDDQVVKFAKANISPAINRPAEVPRGTLPTQTGELADDSQVPSSFVSWENLGLQKNDRGPYPNEANAAAILTRHPQYAGRVWLDEFSQVLMFDTRRFCKTDALQILEWIQLGLRIPKFPLQAVERGAVLVGAKNARHPLKDWLTGLAWDGTARLDTLLSDYWGAPQNRYTASVGVSWITSMIARVYDPGCQADYMPVFEGLQGITKSKALRILGGAHFLESSEDPIRNRKDFLLSLQGKWLVEIPEMHAISGKDDGVEKVKTLITIKIDSYRVPYGATTMDYPRQCIFAGTTNRDTWNPDPTGGRRFWPVKCGAIDLDLLEQNRDQLFAEAVARYFRVPFGTDPYARLAAQADWWDVPVDLARVEQEDRRIGDEWEQLIEAYVSLVPRINGFGSVERDSHNRIIYDLAKTPKTELTVADVMLNCLDIPRAKWTRSDQMRVAYAIQAIGFQKVRKRDGVVRQWAYYRTSHGSTV